MSGKRTVPKREILSIISDLHNIKLTNYVYTILHTLEYIHYVDVKKEIQERQDRLKLFKPTKFVTFYKPKSKKISRGCRACLDNKITHIRHSDKCNCSCDYCYYYDQSEDLNMIPYWAYRESFTQEHLDVDELRLLLAKQFKGKVAAIGWLDREPLMNMEKMKPIMEFINVYQYLYTNGVYATEDNLKRLRDWGLNEIRFNLQATDFNSDVLSNLANACKIIDTVCIETPIYSKSYHNIIKHKSLINNIGLSQINLAELQLNNRNINLFRNEGLVYRNRRQYVSPISSRHYVYDIIELAIDEKWDIVLNDCSNDTKYYRDVPRFESVDIKTGLCYHTEFDFLPPSYYYDVVNKYVDTELEI